MQCSATNQLSNTANNKFAVAPPTAQLIIDHVSMMCCYNILISISSAQQAIVESRLPILSTNDPMNSDAIAPDANPR